MKGVILAAAALVMAGCGGSELAPAKSAEPAPSARESIAPPPPASPTAASGEAHPFEEAWVNDVFKHAAWQARECGQSGTFAVDVTFVAEGSVRATVPGDPTPEARCVERAFAEQGLLDFDGEDVTRRMTIDLSQKPEKPQPVCDCPPHDALCPCGGEKL